MSGSKQDQCRQRVVFKSEKLSLELNATIDCGDGTDQPHPRIVCNQSSSPSGLGDVISATFRLYEGQAVSFVLREPEDGSPEKIDTTMVNELQTSTHEYWARWMKESQYMGRWEQVVTRSLLLLKMLIFEPSGAIVAAPTFSLPEDIGGNIKSATGVQNLTNYRLEELGLPLQLGKGCLIHHVHLVAHGL